MKCYQSFQPRTILFITMISSGLPFNIKDPFSFGGPCNGNKIDCIDLTLSIESYKSKEISISKEDLVDLKCMCTILQCDIEHPNMCNELTSSKSSKKSIKKLKKTAAKQIKADLKQKSNSGVNIAIRIMKFITIGFGSTLQLLQLYSTGKKIKKIIVG